MSGAGEEAIDVARGPSSVAAQEMAFAQESLDAFVRGDEIGSDQQFMLEAVVMPFKRPVIDVVNNKMVDNQLTSNWKSLSADADKKSIIETALLSIGRIDLPNHQLPYAGTGFVVGPDLLMANRHVASIFALGIGDRNLTFIPGQDSKIDFLRELDNPASDALEIVNIRMIHPYWDMALLQVSGLPKNRKPLKLSVADPSSMEGNDVVTIGYPGFDPTPNHEFQQIQSRVFRDIYYVKRVQPGQMRMQEVVTRGHFKTSLRR